MDNDLPMEDNQASQEQLTQAFAPDEQAKKASPGPKTLFFVILVILVAGISAGAVALILANHETPIVQEEESISDEILFTDETFPRIDASLAAQPLMDAFTKNFTGKTTAELGIVYTNTDPAYTKLINNETDLIIASEPSAEELARAEESNVKLEVTKVVNEGFVFFVNKDNPVEKITFEQLRKIYTGEITNWKELGGNDAEIIAYQRPVNSGSQTALISLVMNGEKIKVPTPMESVELDMSGIVDYIADYQNGIDAIGFGFYYYANVMYKNDNLKYLAIDGVAPTYNTIQDGSYPILSAGYIVTRADETAENVLQLKDAMLSKRGQLVASEAGYVPAK